MNKLKYLLFALVFFFCLEFNIYALEEYDVTLNGEVFDWQDEFVYEITINSNDLPTDVKLETYSNDKEFIYLDNEYQLALGTFYRYEILDSNYNVLTDVEGEVEILIHEDDLVEGTKYDVYYFDDSGYPRVLDKEHLGDKAEVVKIDGKLYIRLVTSYLKYFALEMEMSDAYEQAFEEISTDGYFMFPAVKPNKTIDDGFDFYTYFEAYRKSNNHNYTIMPADEYYKDKDYQYMTLVFDDIVGEKHIVKYKWQSSNASKMVENKIKIIEKNIIDNSKSLKDFGTSLDGVYLEIEDLNYINYLYNSDDGVSDLEKIVPYSSVLRDIFAHNNFGYYLDFRAGSGVPFYNYAFGYMLLEHDGLFHSVDFNFGIALKPVIYIPENTIDSDSEYMKAALKRITDYLGTDEVAIEVAISRDEFLNDCPEVMDVWNEKYNEENLSDNIYNITINDKTVKFLIEKNNEKVKEMKFKSKDVDSDVEINTNSGRVPLDTLIEVDIIGKNHKEFKEILDKLNKNDGMIYDLKLYSDSLSKYITKLDNGKFKVMIPLKDEYMNKQLKAYYINDNDEIEEYDISIEDGYAVFETKHFSTYTIAVDGEILPPKTYDGITLNIILVFISLFSLIGTGLYLRRKCSY